MHSIICPLIKSSGDDLFAEVHAQHLVPWAFALTVYVMFCVLCCMPRFVRFVLLSFLGGLGVFVLMAVALVYQVVLLRYDENYGCNVIHSWKREWLPYLDYTKER